MTHKFDPAHIEKLLSSERQSDLRPEELLRAEGLKEGDFFADIGSGPGFFTIPAAKIVGPQGVAFAIDTQAEMLIYLRDRLEPPENVVLLKSEEDSIPLGDSEADFALLAYVLHEAEDKAAFLREVRRVLRPSGKLLVIDWKKQAEEKGPPLEERLSEADSIGLLQKAGFSKPEASSLNPSHYKISATKI